MATVSTTPVQPQTPTGRQPSGLPIATDQIRRRLILAMPEATSDLIDDLVNRTGYDTGELFNIALTLFRTCLDAIEAGQAVGVAAADQELSREFTGFHKNDPAT